ncbi:hypothetical protein P7F73_18115 [Enterobacter sp. EC-ML 621]|uniref:hypothetical protein n=1 Tax=Enterobacter sp. EC-ML 621 TaxID=3037555 RepID=UPI002853B812|nr:hypothetical protein [Enterobacter sp. EC-ML 621]MDR5095730.1 hypothetical protein [Enterobacter sp. EC-ML 621]
MSTITRTEIEAILGRIRQANEKGGVGITREEGERLARIVLASLDASRIGYIEAEYAELLQSGAIESSIVYAEPSEGYIPVYSDQPTTSSVR